MRKKVIVKEEAIKEIIDAAVWLESKQRKLGQKFVTDFEKTSDYISLHPEGFQVKYKEFRQALMKQFPFVITYEIDYDKIIIYAVMHGHRRPRKRFRR